MWIGYNEVVNVSFQVEYQDRFYFVFAFASSSFFRAIIPCTVTFINIKCGSKVKDSTCNQCQKYPQTIVFPQPTHAGWLYPAGEQFVDVDAEVQGGKGKEKQLPISRGR